MSGEVGLSSVLAGETKLRGAIFSTEVPGLYVMPSGPTPENPSELLSGKKFARLLRAMSGKFDRIVIDSPPLLNVTDGQILGAMADTTLLVLRMNRSVRQLAALALEGLAKVGANVLGAVANDVPLHGAYRYYGSSWQYAATDKPLLLTSEVVAHANGDGRELATNGNYRAITRVTT
jgi:capsular exopolysaccharide synthesis family protein